LGVGGCSGVTVPEHLLDDAVMTAVSERVLIPSHLSNLLQTMFDHYAKEEGERDAALPALGARKAASDKALKGLLAIAQMTPEIAEDKIYQQDLAKAAREAKLVDGALQRARSVRETKPTVTPEKIEMFSKSVRELLHGSNRAIAKQVLQSIVTRVEVDDDMIRILGENEQLGRLGGVRSRGGIKFRAPSSWICTQMAEGENLGSNLLRVNRRNGRYTSVPTAGALSGLTRAPRF
jgi:hypothetical protein